MAGGGGKLNPGFVVSSPIWFNALAMVNKKAHTIIKLLHKTYTIQEGGG